jgi:hypothetical protein
MNDSYVRPGTLIRHANVDAFEIILDLRTESYFALDEVASAMWSCLLGGCGDADIAALASRFAVEPARIRADLDAFLDTCLERGFLELTAGASRTTGRSTSMCQKTPTDVNTPSALLVARAAKSLLTVKGMLKRRGFAATYLACLSLVQGSRTDSIDRLARAFRMAENVAVSRRAPDDCFSRSIALFHFLLRSGQPAEHVIGARRVPFGIHAWVECMGKPFLDDSLARPGMTELARITAHNDEALRPA